VRDQARREVETIWHGVELYEPDWSYESRLLAWHMYEAPATKRGEQIYVIANAHWEAHHCALPGVRWGRWCRFLDTSLPSPNEIAEATGVFAEVSQDRYLVGPRSVVVLVAR